MTAASCSTALLRRGLALCLLLAAAPHATAQVYGPGPSDPTLFNTVINLPPDPDFGDYASVGGVDSETTQLNVFEGGYIGVSFDANFGSEVNISGGSVGSYFDANSGSEVNISGGSIGNGFDANSDSEVNISGGSIGNGFDANSDSEVNISGGHVRSLYANSGSVVNVSGGTLEYSRAYSGSVVNVSGGTIGAFDAHFGSEVSVSGGTFGERFSARPNSDVTLIGGEFVLNGVAYTSSAITLAEGDVLTGALADGAAFIFAPLGFDTLSDVTLTQVALPAPALEPIVIDAISTIAPKGLRAGQTLTVYEGGAIGENFKAVDATLNVAGGNVGAHAAAARSVVNISSGTVDDSFAAYSGSEVNISGGIIGDELTAYSGSVVNVSGGSIGDDFNTHSGSEVHISGGSFRGNVDAGVRSNVKLIGGEFAVNGEPYTGASVALSGSDVLTGTLADGSPFIFSSSAGDSFSEDIALSRVALPAVNTTPIVVDSDSPGWPSGLRASQTLMLNEGGVLVNGFDAVDASLRVDGGILGDNAAVAHSVVRIESGSIGDDFHAFSGSEVELVGGVIGDYFSASGGSVVSIKGGTVGDNFQASSGSEVNVTGGRLGEGGGAYSDSVVNIASGVIGSDFAANSGSVMNIIGGTVGRSFQASSGSQVNISGGTVGNSFLAASGSVVEISGGIIGQGFGMNLGSMVSISGGSFERGFTAYWGSEVSVSGGTFGERFTAHPNSNLELIGGDFVLNGVAYTGDAITLAEGDVFSGALADGSAFIFTPLVSDQLSDVTLTRVTLPAPELEPIVIDGASTAAPAGLRAGQTLTVVEGGAVGGNFEAVGATVNVAGGVVGEYSGRVAFADSVVNVADGRIRAVMNAYDGSEVNLSGGEVGIAHSYNSVVNLSGNGRAGYYEGHSGSVLNISGEGFFRRVRGHAGSEVNMGGGNIAEYLHVAGSVVNISGGTVDYSLKTGEGSEINMSGGRVDGSFVAETRSVANISGTSYIQSLTVDPGSEVNISGRSVVDNFTTESNLWAGRGGKKVTIRGGTFGAGFYSDYSSDTEFIGGDFMLDGVAYAGDTVSSSGVFTGTFADGSAFIFSSDVGDYLRDVTLTRVALPDANTEPIIIDATSPPPPAGLRAGQTLTLSEGGVVPNHFEAVDATLSILGGTFGHGGAAARSHVDISGGTLGDSFAAYSGSVVNISGGSIGAAFHAYSGSELNLAGTAFVLEGEPLDGLALGEPLLITARDVLLSGVLADGSSFSFDLNSTTFELEDYFFSPYATLTITLVPTGLPGDYNNDGLVDAADYTVWRDNVGAEAGALPNDPDGGVIGDAQLQTWRASYAASLAAEESDATPEPAGVLLALLAMGLATTRRARR